MIYCGLDAYEKPQVDEHHMKTELEYLLKNTNYSNVDINKLNIEQQYHQLTLLYIEKLNKIEDNLWEKYNRKFKSDYFMLNKKATIHFIYDKNKIESAKKRIHNLSEAELFEECLNKLFRLGKIYYLTPYIDVVNEFYQTHLIPSYYEIRIQHHIDDTPQKHSQLPNIDKKKINGKNQND